MDSDTSDEDYVPPPRRRVFNPEPHVVTIVKSETGDFLPIAKILSTTTKGTFY